MDSNADAIQHIMALTNVDQARATHLFHKYQGDLEKVINQCLDDPDGRLDYQEDNYGVTIPGAYGPQNSHEIHHEPDNFPPTRPTTPMDFVRQTQHGSAVNQRHDENYIPDPTPEFRARKIGSPGFLKPDKGLPAVPGWITTLSYIPAAYDAILGPAMEDTDMEDPDNQNLNWWMGQFIDAHLIQSIDQDGLPETPPHSPIHVFAELRRLFAFLRHSTRKYASATPLYQYSLPLKSLNSHVIRDVIRAVSLSSENELDSDLGHLLTFSGSEGGTLQKHIDTFTLNTSPKKLTSLNQALDYQFFDKVDSVLETLPDILTFDIFPEDPSITAGKEYELPLNLHLDRYLRENRDVMQQAKLLRRQEVRKLDEQAQQLMTTNAAGEYVDIRSFLGRSRDWLQQNSEQRSLSADFWSEQSLEEFASDEKLGGHSDRLTDVLSAITEELDRATAYAAELETARTSYSEKLTLDELMLIEPSSGYPPNPDYTFVLRGVMPHEHQSYFFATDDEDENHDPNDVTPQPRTESEQSRTRWWEAGCRNAYSPDAYADIEGREQEWIREIPIRYRGRLTLVFARHSALESRGQRDLPSDLYEFLKRDDEAFKDDLREDYQRKYGNDQSGSYDEGQRTPDTEPFSDAGITADPPDRTDVEQTGPQSSPPPLPARAPPAIPAKPAAAARPAPADSSGAHPLAARRTNAGTEQRYTGDADNLPNFLNRKGG